MCVPRIKITMHTLFKTHKKHFIALGLFLAAYYPTFLVMWHRWFAADSYYSHGILVPFVSIFLVWQNKEELKKVIIKESPWGLRLIIAGLILYLMMATLRVNIGNSLSMFIVLIGMILHFFGWEMLKKTAFPVFFLIFMLPLPSGTIAKLSFQLKLYAAELATRLLNYMRIPAIRYGSIIKMHTSQVVVDDVCSGLRSLISLTALGSIFAYMMKAPFYKKVLLFLSTIPIAIVTNVCRVFILASVSEIYGAEHIEGFVHDASGYSIFVLAFILLYGMTKIIE